MTPRPRHTPQEAIEEVRRNVGRTYVLAVAVSNYDYLPYLGGPAQDIQMVTEIFAGEGAISLYHERFVSLFDATVEQFRETLLNFALERSARGDVLILYFSGHGAVLHNGNFGFCLRDTVAKPDGGGVLPLSVISFFDVVQTLSGADVFPIFILDACFSGITAPQGSGIVVSTMQDTLQSFMSGSYALLASSSADVLSFDTAFGGGFTRAIHSIIMNGLEGDAGRHFPFITLHELAAPLQERLAQDGHPLSRAHIGPTLPKVPIAKNSKFRPDSETFVPYYKKIVELLWNDGFPREVDLGEILQEVGRGAYANHSKLSYKPWSLLEDGERNSTRRLTERGKLFAQGKLEIPRKIVRDAVTWEWVADPNSEMILISEV